ncbi:MAG: hypothetical protein ACXWIU_06025 [Limisphaerales bacterium]
MTKTLDLITETIRNTKHTFRKLDDNPAKPKKNRYERRKIREYIKLGNWIGNLDETGYQQPQA